MKTYNLMLLFIAVAATVTTYSTRVAASELTYHFFSRQNSRNSYLLKSGQSNLLRNTAFNATKDTLFLIHGWRANNESDFNSKIRDSILSIADINVMVVDWNTFANGNYRSSKNSVVQVGQSVANFIQQLKTEYGLQVERVKFVGWSLGAHIAGNAGAALGGKVDRITGLDPAGPNFSVNDIHERLDPTDAKFVQVIHTSTSLGFNHPSGHADYYPNGGSNQPGCGIDLLGGCSHSRVVDLYSESLNSNGFVGTACSNFNTFRNGGCSSNHQSVMGRFVPDYSARGNYYLNTNNVSPFARG